MQKKYSNRQVGKMSFTLIYCNGCSYSDEDYSEVMKNKTYSNFLQEKIGGFVLNKAISGSNNRRIIRTSLHDLILQRELNPTQKIIALIQLTFEIRGELWYDELNTTIEEESHFVTHQFSGMLDWRDRLLKLLDIGVYNAKIKEKSHLEFLKKYSEGRAFFYSPYQERINLYTDLYMFINTCEKLNIQYLIFHGPIVEKLQNEYLLDFLEKRILNNNKVIDFNKFAFCTWCQSQGFSPLRETENFEIGHYGPDAHKAFAEQLIFPKLEETGHLS
jgi:hypothetical protein